MNGRLLTARELASDLALCTETILRWTRQGQLPAIRLPGGAIRYRESDIEAWLQERATPARGKCQPTPGERRPRDKIPGVSQPPIPRGEPHA